ncbi:PCL6 (YER059W) and PCL7 (YIL050W) [Zygosaccharomyces parabailii]|uniref:ZYBA0S04-03334g1_1 n=1 Tax=Zygosaccharomyces bailii (strain CLIB 213 / ATCC 58445 / CBS 680 / BCRC 21525 / NBRC 1098 / NCYC 1416 / NRRL Y-2227) TaxID=1333698 RepID=A0A8J2T754_ZYGB2|nr:PCL6 (YER059W) and PCL7 (YIL050W) [Zygosaccharomyces parabailii]CDF89398.1 ZYBA0S04-03334g1_1 [Zygosaccharomyces bailii CLIB 213]CDH08357.1 uncharacterized protein ZBAI_00139 [Zygosaccharomyces bailii ISA1307]
MYSVPTVNRVTTAPLRSCSFRSSTDSSDGESLGNNNINNENNDDENRDSSSVSRATNELGHVVTTEHRMSSSQSSLSQHDEHEHETEAPLKSGNSEASVGDETVVDPQSQSPPVRQKENHNDCEASPTVSWRHSQEEDPTARVASPQKYKQEEQSQAQTKLESLDIATFPTDKLLEMLTALLDKIVKSNDRLVDTNFSEQQQQQQQQQQEQHEQQNGYARSVLSFRGKHVPQISLEQYFQRIQKYCPTSNDVFLSLLVYFDRISRRCNSNSHSHSNNNREKKSTTAHSQQFVMDSHNIHRLIIAGTTVSTKFFSDFFYSNSRYARVGGISLQELNHLELQFLVLCDFKLLISVNELQRYADLLYRFWNNSKPQPQPQPEQPQQPQPSPK